MKKNKIIFWIATIIFVLWDGVMPGLTSHTPPCRRSDQETGLPRLFQGYAHRF